MEDNQYGQKSVEEKLKDLEERKKFLNEEKANAAGDNAGKFDRIVAELAEIEEERRKLLGTEEKKEPISS